MFNIFFCSSCTQLHMTSVFLLVMKTQKHIKLLVVLLSCPPSFPPMIMDLSIILYNFSHTWTFFPILIAIRLAFPSARDTLLTNISS